MVPFDEPKSANGYMKGMSTVLVESGGAMNSGQDNQESPNGWTSDEHHAEDQPQRERVRIGADVRDLADMFAYFLPKY